MDSITNLVFQLAVLLMSVVIHEFAHGWAAFYLGDPTAKYYGRLTLNPIKHLDPFGSFIVPVLLVLFRSPVVFGWAKPVPFNPYNLSDQKYGPVKVAAAGPLANLTIALIFGLSLRFLPVSFLSLTGLGP
ncbi:MAG: site-2 protease family protein, partial [Candidatus Portnoybacteria bacterium CG23_combo_of_CG06-09_8_20_14_all_44_36]